MSQENLEVGLNISSNINTVVGQAVRQIDNLGKSLADLADLFRDVAKAQGQTESSIKSVSDANKQAAQSTAKAVSEVDKLREALSKTGREADEAIKALDFSKINLDQLSAKEIEQLAEKLREVGVNLGEFIEGKSIDLNFRPALEELNQLQELLGQPISVAADFSSAQEVFAELRSLNTQLRAEIQETFEQLRIPETVFEPIGRLKAELAEITTPARGDLNLVAELDQTRSAADAVIERAEALREQLREIGPAAQEGNTEAISQFSQLSGELQRVTAEADGLTSKLQQTQQQFQNYISSQNESLEQLRFRPITLEDVFPSAEQRKVAQLQNRINSAVRESVEAGAVQTTLNFFLNANAQITEMDRNVVGLTSQLPRLRYALFDVSNSLAIVGGSLTAISVGTAKVAIDFERMFADVERTVTGTGRQIDRLRKDLISLSQEIPVSFQEITRIATLAGQLNIATDRVAEFTETVAKFAATSDVTIEAAATAFGRLDQLVAGVDGQFEKLGAAISAVGINAVATESEIVAISAQIASIANIAGFSAGELVGFASALASVGTRPELARGTFTRLFTEISQAAAGTKDTLDGFARLAGRTAEDFQEAWGRGQGPELVIDFLKGLQAEGRNAELALREVGITSVRDVPTLLKLAQSVNEVEKQLSIAQIAFIEGTELQRQYSIVATTVAEKLQVLRNSFQALVATIGDSAQFLGVAIDGFTGLLNILQKILDNPVNRFLIGTSVALIGVVGALSLLGAGFVRAAAGFAGLLTASTETAKAIAFTRLNVRGLKTEKKALAASSATVSAELTRVGTAGKVAAAGIGSTSTAAVAATGNFAKMRQLFQTGLIPGLLGLIKNFRFLPLIIAGFKFAAIFAGLTLLTKGVELLGNRFGWWGDEIDKVQGKLGDLSPFMSAVQRDTRELLDGTQKAGNGMITFSGEVEANNVELSKRGRVIAIATGQEDLLKDSADGLTTSISNQTLAIGQNTQALIRQKIAQDLVNAAQEDAISKYRIQRALLIAERTSPGITRSIALDFQGITDPGSQIGVPSLVEVIADPALNAALKEAGFNFSAWVELVTQGSDEAAAAMLNNLAPAAREVKEELEAKDPEAYADAILYLNGVIEFGADGLKNYASTGSELQQAIKALVFEQTVLGEIFEDTADAVETFQNALKSVVDDAFAASNAQRELEDALYALGQAFANESPEVVASSREMQRAIKAVIDTAASPEEAIEKMGQFYQSIVDGGYASEEQLEILQSVIRQTFNDFIQASLQSLRIQRAALAAASAARRGSGARLPGQNLGDIRAEQAALDAQIAELERAARAVTFETGASADMSGKLAQGYQDAKDAANGTASAARNIKDNTKDAQKEVRTLLDYARDLNSVISRAFDLRFKTELQLDKIADSWERLNEQVRDARENLARLSADRAVREYFLSIAEAYGDTLRADVIREEIADLDKEIAKNQAVVNRETQSNSVEARENRRILSGLVKEYQDYIIALAESGASQDELRRETQRARNEFTEQARALGFAEADIKKYATAFDDVTFAINRVPRNVTIEADVNPALTALRELQAQQERNIRLADDLNRAMNQPVAARPPSSAPAPAPAPAPNNSAQRNELIQLRNRLERDLSAAVSERTRQRALANNSSVPTLVRQQAQSRISQLNSQISSLSGQINVLNTRIAALAQGGLVKGRGGPTEDKVPAMLSPGEYVIKAAAVRKFGVPFFDQLNQMRAPQFMGVMGQAPQASGTSSVVELSAYDRKLLAEAGNIELRLDGRVLAANSNAKSLNASQRGTN